MTTLETTVAGVKLGCCVYNASGPRTGLGGALVKIGQSRAGAVLSKDGNAMPRYKELDLGKGACGSINSEGLPNKGIDYYISAEVVDACKATGKPYFCSLSGLKLADNLEMLSRAAKVANIDAIELNLACPNIPGKPTIAYDFEQMDEVLGAVCSHPASKKKPLGVKLAPYFDIPHFQRAAEILNKYPIKYVVCTNTVGNALCVDAENEMALISPKGGFGGLGGGYVKQIALANVRQMSQLLRADIDVVGVGGVKTGTDAFELILCGAAAVQVGTQHFGEGPSCFDRIAGELEALMKRKGYSSIEQFRGKLKPYSKPAGGAKAAKGGDDEGGVAGKKQEGSAANLLIVVLIALVAWLLGRDPTVKAWIASLAK